ncbi:hypothetical protein POTOM_049010 [Populus tomentosa]|uniref:Vesicle transport protein n=1 Tax=Populus tomentosa TaxID=118781 RepID=A0A8X7Y530_POPTO|nr:hypothetical protein POTOM_049010 [Populus tomentosa]
MWKLNQFIPDDDGEREESLLEEESDGICSLSPTQRMYAFAASLAAGLILMFLTTLHNTNMVQPIANLILNFLFPAKASKRDKLSASADHLAFVMLPLHLSHLSLIVFAKPIKFALLFTFGNVLAVGSTAFLIGPGRQLGMMFDPIRIYATVIYIGCVVLALIFALLVSQQFQFISEWVNLKSFLPLFVPSDELSFLVLSFLCCLSEELLSLFHKFTKISVKIHSKILTVFAIIFEICALIWYGLSYIPFARRMVSSLMIRLFDTEL